MNRTSRIVMSALVTAVIVLVCGAEDFPSAAGPGDAAGGEAAGPAVNERPVQNSLPVVLLRELDVPPAADKLAEILRAAAPVTPQRAKAWFVLVHYNMEGLCFATLCFQPDGRGPRLRKGLWASVSLNRANGRTKATGVYPYAQVSLKDRPFGDGLETPTREDLPFWLLPDKAELDDAGLVALVDHARAVFRDRLKEDPDLAFLDCDKPVCAVLRQGKDKDVFAVAAGVWGLGGCWITFRRKGGQFEAVLGPDSSVNHWSGRLDLSTVEPV